MDDAAVAFHQALQVFVVHLGHVHRLEARAEQAQALQARQRPLAMGVQALLHFQLGFMHVHLDVGVQLLGQHHDLAQLLVGHRVGGVRAEGRRQARVMAQLVEQLQGLAHRVAGIQRARHGEIHQRHAELRAHAGAMRYLAGHPRVEVHVGKAGDAALELFGDGQLAAVADEILVHPDRFGRPDVVLQPGQQRQVVGQAAKQAHGGVAVGIHQPGGEQHAGQFAHLAGLQAQGLFARGEQGDAPVADAQRVILQHHAGRLDRNQPTRQQKEVERSGGGHGGIHTTMTGRQCTAASGGF